jgi:hypothetical protein
MAAFHTERSLGTSNTFPSRGYPLGPGGYGNLELRRLILRRIKETATAREIPSRGDTESMGDRRKEDSMRGYKATRSYIATTGE